MVKACPYYVMSLVNCGDALHTVPIVTTSVTMCGLNKFIPNQSYAKLAIIESPVIWPKQTVILLI